MVQKMAKFIADLLRFHKKKILLVFVSALFFVFILFPYEDLADLVTAQIAAATQNQVFIQFEDMGIGIFPILSVDLEKVSVETPMLPTLTVDALQLAPSVSSLLQFKMGFSAFAEGLLKGDLSLTARTGKAIGEEGVRQILLDADYSNLNLRSVKETFELPINLEGVAKIILDAKIDPSFVEQPEGETEINITKLRLPPSTVPTPMGPMALPNIQFSTVASKLRLAAGDLVIEEAQLGDPSEPLSGRIKGQMGMRMQRRGISVQPQLGAYDLRVELNVRKGAEKDLALFLSFLGNYKNPTLTGSRYAFRIRGSSFGSNPDITPLANF